MIVESYRIPGGDLHQAGAASRSLKERLKKVGVESGVLRRVMIAAYEAELNVVIHARQGTMWARLDDGRLDLEVADEGPGIPDIEQAMQEGWSTAPAEARALGFGAGMGLPNIRRSSDRFEIFSEVGRGTRVRSTIYLRPESARAAGRASLRVRPERCRSCLACLRACPTQALRVREGRPQVLEHRCIDCTACIGACSSGALEIDPAGAAEDGAFVGQAAGGTVILPAALLADLAPVADPARVLEGIAGLGFGRVRLLEEWEAALREAVGGHARDGGTPRPVIAPICPAVVNLIELRFPTLIRHLAPFRTPIGAALGAYALREALLVAPCPAACGSLAEAGPAFPVRVVSLARFEEWLLPRLKGRGGAGTAGGREGPLASGVPGAAALRAEALRVETPLRVVAAGGIDHALAVLEAAEEGRLGDVDVLELSACPLGCFGSPLLRENAYLGRHRWQLLAREGGWRADGPLPAGAGPAAGAVPCSAGRDETLRVSSDSADRIAPGADSVAESRSVSSRPSLPGGPRAEAVRRMDPFRPRSGLRLDDDMAAAMEKLARIDRLARALPGRDCGACGAPTCTGLAEDIVLGGRDAPAEHGVLERAGADDCPYSYFGGEA